MSDQHDRQRELKAMFGQLMGEGEQPDTGARAAADQPARRRPNRKRTTGTRAPAQKAPARAARKAAVTPMPVTQAPADTGRPERLMVPLSRDEAVALRALRLEDGLPAAARVRAMLQLYREDERYRRAVDRTAQRMR